MSVPLRVFLFVLVGAVLVLAVRLNAYFDMRRYWMDTKSRYGGKEVSYMVFVSTWYHTPHRWCLYEDHVSFDGVDLAFGKYSDFRRYRKFKVRRDRIYQKASDEKDMKRVREELMKLYDSEEGSNKIDGKVH